MKVITFTLQKGGTGKTSVAVAVAAELAKIGRTLLIDADTQGNASRWVGIEEAQKEFADILMNSESTKEDITSAIQRTNVDNLMVLPTTSKSLKLANYQKYGATEDPYAVKRMLRKISSEYNFCVIDSSPSFLGIESACYLASNEIIPVIQPEEFAIRGLYTLCANIAALRNRFDLSIRDTNERVNKWVITAIDRRVDLQKSLTKWVETAIAEKRTYVKLYKLPVDQSFPKAQEAHIPVQQIKTIKQETSDTIKELALDLSETGENIPKKGFKPEWIKEHPSYAE